MASLPSASAEEVPMEIESVHVSPRISPEDGHLLDNLRNNSLFRVSE